MEEVKVMFRVLLCALLLIFPITWADNKGNEQLLLALRLALAEKVPFQDFDIQIDQAFQKMDIDTKEKLNVDYDDKRWFCQVKKDNQIIRISGRVVPLIDVPVLVHPLGPGQIIKENEISWQKMPMERLTPTTVRTPDGLIGLTSSHRMLQPFQTIQESDLKKPILVKRGQTVRIVYKTPNIYLESYGEAQTNGAKGDVISIRRSGTKKDISAEIIDGNTATLTVPKQT